MTSLKVDGGAVRDNFLLQFQADICRAAVMRPFIQEKSALGAAYLAGLTVGFWKNKDEVKSLYQSDTVFEPGIDNQTREKLIAGWHKAVGRSRGWAEASP